MSAASLIVGLGNPGKEYEQTRHNAGFLCLDALAERSGGESWKLVKRFPDCLVSEASLGSQQVLLVKPQAFMNRSGRPVRMIREYYDSIDELIVVHDELDLPFGELRLKFGGGDGGHNGIRSLVSELGTKDFFRVRVGIGRPPQEWGRETGSESAVSAWVLSRFTSAEMVLLESILEAGCEGIESLVRDGLERAQQLIHGRSFAPGS
ncbi:MAG: aminoacyl-tRNA hydrolase [Bdellovibrionales bacterium]|nr:aminoacyl-tRNA hydrolase [Bdellovibrionales bacterium]